MPEENAIPWTGEGLPPVGTVCELVCDGVEQGVITVMYISEQFAVCRNHEYLFEQGAVTSRYRFRPISTPEQIAPSEREKAVLEIAHILIDNRASCAEYHQARLIYDAGYRKQVRP